MTFEEYNSQLSEADASILGAYWQDFSSHCQLRGREYRKLKSDFEKAILHYAEQGKALAEILALLAIQNLGGFYARPPILWFPLDDAAKIYPLSLGHGRMAVFRLSVYLKQDVVPELLQMALNFTIRRFPSFATTLKKGFFWHYLDTTKRRFNIAPEQDVPCQPLKVSASGSQSFRVLYYHNRISLELFHVLTDGTGGLTFLKVLTAEYLRLTGVSFRPHDSVWNIGATPATEEFENAFAKVPQSDTASGFVDKPAVQMNGRLSAIKPCRILHFVMNAEQLRAAAQRHSATVSVYMLAQMFLAGRAATDDLQGEASIQVPVNMRKFYPSKTVRNFSMYCGVRLPVAEINDIDSIIGPIRDQINQKTTKEVMSQMLTATERLVNTLKLIPLIIKQPVAKLVYGFLGDKIFSNTLSNMGIVEMPPELVPYIDRIDFTLGPEISNRVSCTLATFQNTATFTVTKMTVDPSFEEKMHDLLTADGIHVQVEGSALYER